MIGIIIERTRCFSVVTKCKNELYLFTRMLNKAIEKHYQCNAIILYHYTDGDLFGYGDNSSCQFGMKTQGDSHFQVNAQEQEKWIPLKLSYDKARHKVSFLSAGEKTIFVAFELKYLPFKKLYGLVQQQQQQAFKDVTIVTHQKK